MRTTLAVAFAAALLAAPAASRGETVESAIKGNPGHYGAAGCGLGAMAFGSQPGGPQILASITNWILPIQSFAITTGTSNCGAGAFAQGTKNFVDANREAVAKDVSRGEGESIGALSVINACQDSRAVGAALQKNFKSIFPSEAASNEQVTNAILETLQSDKSLGCGRG